MMRNCLENQGYKVLELAYADYLKTIVQRNFFIESEEKYRDLLQFFGTEVVRSLEEGFWVNVVFHTIDLLSKRYNDNELEAVYENMKIIDEDDFETDKKFLSLKLQEVLKYDAFIITDARYENELQPSPYTICYNVHNVLIEREDTSFRMTEEQREHSSEQIATNPEVTDFFATICNDGSLEELEANCCAVVEEILQDRDEKYKEFLSGCKGLYNKMEQETQELE